jgi:D-lactate dehydrogenase (cytochrome)
MNTMPAPDDTNDARILAALAAVLPAEAIAHDDATRAALASDVFFTGVAPPVACVRPNTTDQVVALVHAARATGFTLAPRGAGLSYSAGYVPADRRTVMVDLRGMDRILEINATDRYVVVEPGVTWEALYTALAPTGLRTPFWGTFSGRHATIGGALSQGAKFFGSGDHGSAAESVLSLDVVVGDGSIVTTGSAGTPHQPTPFYRYHGPDLTGVFLGDCGAYGIKTRIALQLVPRPGHVRTASFAFDTAGAMFGAMTTIGADLLAAECFAMDPFLVDLRMRFEGLDEDLESFRAVFRAGRGLAQGLRDAAGLALRGRRFLADVGFMMSAVTEAASAEEAERKMRAVRAIAHERGGRDLPDSLPKVVRAAPFRRLNRLLGPAGERIVWFHAMLPNSRALALYEETERVFATFAADVERFGLRWGYLISVNGPSTFGLEPIVYWKDAPHPIHAEYIDPDHLARLPRHPPDPAAREAVTRIRTAVVTRWSELGATHLQIGREYPFLATRTAGTRAAYLAMKRAFDPDGLFNPGVLSG